MGKGSERRPVTDPRLTEEELARRWAATFGQPDGGHTTDDRDRPRAHAGHGASDSMGGG